MKRIRILIYEIGDEYLYETIEEDDAEIALKKLCYAINYYRGGIRIRYEINEREE